MEIREIQAIVESLLFAAGEAVSLEQIADIVDVDKKSLREIIDDMINTYNYEKRGIRIIRLENSYRMCTRGEYAEYVSMLMKPKRKLQLSNAAIEVLAITAYKQPVTRGEIEHIRGVNCDYIINRLVERGFIVEVGRMKDAPGHPILFGTTKKFLETFGIESIADLPEFDTLAVSSENEQTDIDDVFAQVSDEEAKDVPNVKLVNDIDSLNIGDNDEDVEDDENNIDADSDDFDFDDNFETDGD